MSSKQESASHSNGGSSVPSSAHHINSSSSSSTEHTFLEDDLLKESEEDTPVVQIERDLDELTFSGAAINDLEVQLTRTKHLYQQVLVEGRARVDMLRKKLHSHIIKSEPFIEVWRKARQVQEMSNKAAARYDKANSQHLASKEMIRVAESQLAECRAGQTSEEVSSPSPLDLAWQEMLNHATAKVVVTEKERRDSELDHRRVLEECKKVMEDYKNIERKLRTHIVKSRPYFQERFRVNQQLIKLKDTMKSLELKINESKQAYSASLKRLEVLNTEMHVRRGTLTGVEKHHLDPRQISSARTTPELKRTRRGKEREEDLRSVDSMRMATGYSGSTGSLPSIGVASNTQSPSSDSDSKSLDLDTRQSNSPTNPDVSSDSRYVTPEASQLPGRQAPQPPQLSHSSDTDTPTTHESSLNSPDDTTTDSDFTFPTSNSGKACPEASSSYSSFSGSRSEGGSGSGCGNGCSSGREEEEEEQLSQVASDIVVRCLASASNMLYQENKSTLT